MKELLKNDIFSSLRYHDVQNHDPFQDLHSTQISKAIVNEFLNIRLLCYGNIGKRTGLYETNFVERIMVYIPYYYLQTLIII